MSLTHNLNDFIGPIHPCGIHEMNGLTTSTKIVGEGTVEWTIQDLFGTTHTIHTLAYYVPEVNIHLRSLQSCSKNMTVVEVSLMQIESPSPYPTGQISSSLTMHGTTYHSCYQDSHLTMALPVRMHLPSRMATQLHHTCQLLKRPAITSLKFRRSS